MTARLVLHVGDCKAGSTAIQSVLKAGSYRLDGAAPGMISYAEAGRKGTLNHQRLSNSLFMQEAAAFRDQAWGNLGREWHACQAQVLAVSSERFEFAPPAAVRDAIEQHLPEAADAMRIIIYVRPHADRLVSGYAQNVKQGIYNGDLAGFVDEMQENGRLSYCDRLLNWRDTFGPERVEIRPMIRDRLVQQCVVHDFLSFCAESADISPVVEKIPMSNTALDRLGLDLMNEIWSRVRRNNPVNNQARAQILMRVAQGLEAAGGLGGGKVSIEAGLADRLRALYHEDAARCDAEIFGAPTLLPRLEATLEKAGDTAPQPSDEDARLIDTNAKQAMVWFGLIEEMQRQQAMAARQKQARGGGGQGQKRPQGAARGMRPTR